MFWNPTEQAFYAFCCLIYNKKRSNDAYLHAKPVKKATFAWSRSSVAV